MNVSGFVSEFHNQQEVSMERCLAMDVGINVCKTNKNWISDVIANHDRDIGLVG